MASGTVHPAARERNVGRSRGRPPSLVVASRDSCSGSHVTDDIAVQLYGVASGNAGGSIGRQPVTPKEECSQTRVFRTTRDRIEI